MGNQQAQGNENTSNNISQYYQKMLYQNKENLPYQLGKGQKLLTTESRNKLKPTSKINIDMKLCSKSSEKSLTDASQKQSLDIPTVSNPLQKLHRKRSSTKIVQDNDESHIQLLDLLKNMVRHQDSTMQSSETKQNEQSGRDYNQNKQTEIEQTISQPIEDRPLQLNLNIFNRRRSKTFEESFRTLISNEERCQPLKTLRQESQEDEQALQFILQNCTQTQSRIDQSKSLTFESLESDWQIMTKKNSKQLETPGTAQFQGLNNKDDKIFELSTSNFIEVNEEPEDIEQSRRPSCMESSFLIPIILHSQNSLEFDDDVNSVIKPKKLSYNQLIESKDCFPLQMQSQTTLNNKLTTRPNISIQTTQRPQNTNTCGLPNQAPLKHKSFHQSSLPQQCISKTTRNYSQSNGNIINHAPQPSYSTKNTKQSNFSKQSNRNITYPEEQWLNNSKLEYKKMMFILEQQQSQISNFSIQNKSQIISNSSITSDIHRSNLQEINFRLKPQCQDKNTQTQLKDIQKDFINRISQPKNKSFSKISEPVSNPYWKLREVDQTKRTKRK